MGALFLYPLFGKCFEAQGASDRPSLWHSFAVIALGVFRVGLVSSFRDSLENSSDSL
jgi:hypothetical protein